MKKLIICLCFILSSPASAEENFPPFTTHPLKIQPVLSSSFAEYRVDHFHAGIDYKTWGKEGYRVYAVGNGSVVRIRTSPWFYGKAVYLKLTTGETAVYAHLSRFIPRFEEIIRKAQSREETYEVDVHIPEGDLTIREGEVLAYTGSTGTGLPHLHFELRDRQNRPINPIKRGFGYRDIIPPIFQRVAFIPLDAHSLVNSLPDEGIESFKASGSAGSFSIEKTPLLLGQIGVAVEIKDFTQSAPNNLGIYRLSLFKNGKLLYEKRYEYFSYADSRKINIDMNYHLLATDVGVFHNLFLEPGNDLHFYRHSNKGVLNLPVENPDSPLELISIEAEDFAGNVSQAEFFVRVGMPPVISRFTLNEETTTDFFLKAEGRGIPLRSLIVESSPDGGESWRRTVEEPVGHLFLSTHLRIPPSDNPCLFRVYVQDSTGVASPFRYHFAGELPDSISHPLTIEPTFRGNLLILHLHTETGFREPPTLKIKGTWGFHKSVAFHETGWGSYVAKATLRGISPKVWVELPTQSSQQEKKIQRREYTFHRVQAANKSSFEDPSGIRIDCPPGSFYQDTYLGLDWLEENLPNEGELRPASKILRIFPRDVPLAGKINLGLRSIGKTTEDGSSRDSGNTSAVEFEATGLYQAGSKGEWKFLDSARDGDFIRGECFHLGDFALFIDNTHPQITNMRPRGTTSKRRPLISAYIKDEGSGIKRDRDIRMWFDDYRIYAAYDPESDLLTYQVRYRQKPGKHTIRVSVRDMQGNENTVSWDFRIAGK